MYEKVEIETGIPLDHIGRVYKMISVIPFFQEKESRISKIEILPGGLTNTNYTVTIDGERYAVRLAGDGTAEYMDRPGEKHNAQIAADLGIGAPIIYYDGKTGNQVCRYIDGITLVNDHFMDGQYIPRIAKVLRTYHNCGKKFITEFNPLRETHSYRDIIEQKKHAFYEGSELMVQKFAEIEALLEKYPAEPAPCHNDTLPANWMDDKKNMYLIDWEYAGMNDPLFDLAALSLESNMSEENEHYLMSEYYGAEPTEKQWGGIIINKFIQDVLWSYWSIVQIAAGKDYDLYWNYGLNRYNRGYKLIHDGTLDRAIKARAE